MLRMKWLSKNGKKENEKNVSGGVNNFTAFCYSLAFLFSKEDKPGTKGEAATGNKGGANTEEARAKAGDKGNGSLSERHK